MKWWKNINEEIKEEEKEYNDKERIDNELKKSKTNTNSEVWKWVVGYERWYEVSNYGNIRKIKDDGTKKLLKTKDSKRGHVVGLRRMGSLKNFMVSHLVAEAFKLKTTEKNKNHVYHIDGNINNDCLSNLTYDYTETESYIKEHAKEEKTELKEYVEANKEFLKQAKEINKEITLKDIYDKLNELIEVIKNDHR